MTPARTAELLATVVIALLAVTWALGAAVDGALARSLESLPEGGVLAIDEAAARGDARRSAVLFLSGVLVLTAGRLLAERHAQRPGISAAALLVPCATLASGLAIALHHGYADLATGRFLHGGAVAEGVFWGLCAAGWLAALPWDPGYAATRTRWLLAGLALATLGALASLGEGPGDARVRLLGTQPIEGVKIAFAAFLATSLGRRAEELRFLRRRRAGLRLPRLRDLLPALAVLTLLLAGLAAVRDLGPSLILVLVFLAAYAAATRSLWGPLLACVSAAGLLALFAARPDLLPNHVAVRLGMWRDPWNNGLAGGDQLATALWAWAAGGSFGQGWGNAEIRLLPAGHTDLVLSHLAEVLGLAGLATYLGAVGTIVLAGMWIGTRNRTPERMLLAHGLAILLGAQLLVIFAGATGLAPLTGVVTPLLSYGKTGLITFLALVGVLLRLAVDGHPRVPRDELRELAGGIGWSMVAVGMLGVVLLAAAAHRTLADRAEVLTRSVQTTGWDGRALERRDPRLRALERRVGRGDLLDRNGTAVATNDTTGHRIHLLGDALGTLLGPLDPAVVPPSWALEGLHDQRLRPSPLLPILLERGEARRQAERQMRDSRPARSIHLSLDAELQRAAAAALAEVVPEHDGAAGAVAVVDVDSGEVLVRAQWPDIDPGRPEIWRNALLAGEPSFHGSYGPWRDKTGPAGLYQAGSVFKLVTALAAVRAAERSGKGPLDQAEGSCTAPPVHTFACRLLDRQGPYVTRPGWRRPIHDGHSRPDGVLGLPRALAVSCNVYFAQLGLVLGPEAFTELVDAGLEVDGGRGIVPGKPGSRHLGATSFGQGAARLHVVEAARLAAAVGGAGVYRICPPTLELGATCEEHRLVERASSLKPILAGMRRAVTEGTARRLTAPQGVRLYAKTGTATDPWRADEGLFLAARREAGADGSGPENPTPHSWITVLAESAESPACGAQVPGRMALAVVVPRGGAGSRPALEIARRVIEAASELGYF